MPNSGSSSDNHPAAALRHYHDAVVLQSASCREMHYVTMHFLLNAPKKHSSVGVQGNLWKTLLMLLDW